MSLPVNLDNRRLHLAPDARVVVLGASGWIGLHLVSYLLRSTQWTIECWVRRGAAAAAVRGLCADERRLQIRCSDTLFDLSVSPDTRVVVHGASPTNHWDVPGSIDTNVALTWRLLDDLSGRPEPPRLVYLSTLLIRGDSRVAFSEEDLNAGQSFLTPYAQSKFLAESTIQNTYARSVETVILRLGSVLWSRSGGALPKRDWLCQSIWLWLKDSLPIIPLSADHCFYPIPVDELCSLIGYSIVSPDVPKVVHVPYEKGPTLGSVFDFLARETGKSKRRFCPPNSDQWAEFLNSLPPSTLKRRITALFPVPPKGATMSGVRSEQSRIWIERGDLKHFPLTEGYWLRALPNAD